jgi:hypothetical protein
MSDAVIGALVGGVVGAIAGAPLAVVAGVIVARTQERHRVRVTILREVLPEFRLHLYAHNVDSFAKVEELVTLSMVLRKAERRSVAVLAAIYEDRKRLGHMPGVDRDKATPKDKALIDQHRALSARHTKALRDLRMILAARLRIGTLSATEKRALQQ